MDVFVDHYLCYTRCCGTAHTVHGAPWCVCALCFSSSFLLFCCVASPLSRNKIKQKMDIIEKENYKVVEVWVADTQTRQQRRQRRQQYSRKWRICSKRYLFSSHFLVTVIRCCSTLHSKRFANVSKCRAHTLTSFTCVCVCMRAAWRAQIKFFLLFFSSSHFTVCSPFDAMRVYIFI